MSSEPNTVPWNGSGTGVERPRFIDPEGAFDTAQETLGRKWHLRIVYHLLEDGPLGFSALKSVLVGVSSKMLSESLILVAVILLFASLCYLRIQTLSAWILNSSFYILTATSIRSRKPHPQRAR